MQDGLVAGDVRLRGQRVHRLRAGDARDRLHREGRDLRVAASAWPSRRSSAAAGSRSAARRRACRATSAGVGRRDLRRRRRRPRSRRSPAWRRPPRRRRRGSCAPAPAPARRRPRWPRALSLRTTSGTSATRRSPRRGLLRDSESHRARTVQRWQDGTAEHATSGLAGQVGRADLSISPSDQPADVPRRARAVRGTSAPYRRRSTTAAAAARAPRAPARSPRPASGRSCGCSGRRRRATWSERRYATGERAPRAALAVGVAAGGDAGPGRRRPADWALERPPRLRAGSRRRGSGGARATWRRAGRARRAGRGDRERLERAAPCRRSRSGRRGRRS